MIRIIIPAYNEEKNIKKCVTDISKQINKIGKSYKIYVINDGSTDKTKDILLFLKKTIPLTIIAHKKNLGPSEAFRSGFNQVSRNSRDNDILIVLEGDATSDPKLIPQIVKKIDFGYEVVICSRYVKGGKYVNFPPRRLIFSIGANFLLKILFPIKNVKDYTIFYRGYKASVIKKLIKKYKKRFITTKHYVANSEILIKLSTITNKIIEIPLIYNYGNKKNPSAMKIASNIKTYLNFISRSLFKNTTK